MFKKSQASYTDFLIGFFVLILITFIFIRVNIDLNSKNNNFQELIIDGTEISNSLMNNGYKILNWNDAQPQGRLGFLNDGKIIKENFDQFAQTTYDKTKILLGTKKDYLVYFEHDNKILSYNERQFYGKYDNINKIKSSNIVKITRLVYSSLHDKKVVKMIILVF